MDRTGHKLNILWITLPVFLIVCIAGLLLSGKREPRDIVVFGDSRIVGPGLTVTIPDMIEASTGLSVCNGAFGGTTLSMTGRDGYTEPFTELSMVSLSRAAAFGSFGPIEAVLDTASFAYVNLEDYRKAAAELGKTGLKKASFIVIAQGVNDATLGIPARNPEDPRDPMSFEGALREIVENIRIAAPKAKIVLVSPVFFSLEGLKDRLGLLREYRDAEKDIAGEYGLIFADAFSESGIDESNVSEYMRDGLHYTPEGAKIVADLIIKAIEDNK